MTTVNVIIVDGATFDLKLKFGNKEWEKSKWENLNWDYYKYDFSRNINVRHLIMKPRII